MGLDASTQSLTACVIDVDEQTKVAELSIDYRGDGRLTDYGIGSDYLIPPRVEGEADQPARMFLAALDAMLDDLVEAGIAMERIAVINVSGQQHGHVYFGAESETCFAELRRTKSAESNLVSLLNSSLAYNAAPIWMTLNTTDQADFVRRKVGGSQAMIKISGSDAPLRFTGTVVRRVAEQFPGVYSATKTVQLISSWIPAVLCANPRVPIDIGNACGMTLMDYRKKQWSSKLVAAQATDLPGGTKSLKAKLPELAEPNSIVGKVAAYFVKKYGLSRSCKIAAGSGDNPQAKVLVQGDLLSLGTSFVNMVSTDGKSVDLQGLANAMYDGVGRPFMFGCRTNGALVWDAVRHQYGLGKEDYSQAEQALTQTKPGSNMVVWQPKGESFPLSNAIAMKRITPRGKGGLATDYSGVIETSLATVYLYSKSFALPTADTLFATGGATESSEIMRRVAGIWNRTVIPIAKGGPALGAAVAGASAISSRDFDVDALSAKVLKRSKPIAPRPDDVEAYHGKGDYLNRFSEKYAALI